MRQNLERLRSCSTSDAVLLGPASVFKPFTRLPIGSFILILSFSARVSSAAAVNIFVVEPRRKSISGCISAFVSTFATPNAF